MHGDPVHFEIEERLAEHVATTRADSLPDDVVQQSLRAILWWSATALEGATEIHQAPLRAYVSHQGRTREANVLGSGLRTTAEFAALVNGRAGKACEHEDKIWADGSIGIAMGVCVVPAAVAVAQARGGVSGRELLAAVALAIDVEARLARPLGLGFVPGKAVANATFALGTYGAAVAAAKVLELDAAGVLDALGLAHAQASGNFQGQFEGRAVSLQCGFAVRNGVIAARLAAAGRPGVRASLTGRAGLYAVHYPACEVDPESIVRDLGTDYLGVRQGLKAYPSGIVAHAAVDAVRSVRTRVQNGRVDRIEVEGPPTLRIMAEPIEAKRAPRSAVEAQFSIPWAVACGVRDGDLTVDHYDDAALGDGELQRLAGAVTITMGDQHQGTRVRLVMSDGSVAESDAVLVARGHPDNPLPTEDIVELFLRSADRAMVAPADAQDALAKLRRLSSEPDVDAIFSLLKGTLPS
jgi:2-methylcitrate dehydratase PrpD